MRGIKRCLVFPPCCGQVIHPVLLAANTLTPTDAPSSRAGLPDSGSGYGGTTHLELILMPVVDLRAGDTTWLSSASTEWRRLSFTTYWLLLVGCHWTPKILKKEKQGEIVRPFLSSPLSRRLLSSISSKRAFQSTKSPALLAKCRKRKSRSTQPLPRCGRRQHQVRTTGWGSSCPWLIWGDGLVTPCGLSLSLQGGVTPALPQKERAAEGGGRCSCLAWVMPGMGDAWRLQTGNRCLPKHYSSFRSI